MKTIYISDIDETYFITKVRTVAKFFDNGLRFAANRLKTFPGMSGFYRTARACDDAELHFVSASPPQLDHCYRRAFDKEGVTLDSLTLRDMLGLALKGSYQEVRDPFIFKVLAISRIIAAAPPWSKVILIGDDTEADPAIYSFIRDVSLDAQQTSSFIEQLRGRGIDERRAVMVLDRCKAAVVDCTVAAIFIRRIEPSCPSLPAGVFTFTSPQEIMQALRAVL